MKKLPKQDINHTDANLLSLSQEHRRATKPNILLRLLFILFIILLGAIVLLIDTQSWQGSPAFYQHTNLLLIALSLIAGFMALIKYFTRKRPKYLFIGYGFIGVFLIELVNFVRYIQLSYGSDANDQLLIPVINPFASMFLLGLFIIVSWFYRERLYNIVVVKLNATPLRAITILIIASSLLVFAAYFIPVTTLLFINLLLFSIAVILYLIKGMWRWKFFEYFLLLSLILLIYTHVYFLLSVHEFDTWFSIGILARTISIWLVVIGLLISMYLAFKEVEDAKAKIDTILDSIGDSVFVTDINGNIVLINKAALKLSEKTYENVATKPYNEVFHFSYEDDPNKKYSDFVKRVVTKGKTLAVANHTILSDTRLKTPVAIVASAIRDEGGTIVGCAVALRDMTQERELEKSKDNFISIVAHQLRTPLGAMRWSLEVLLSGDSGKLTPKAKSRIATVYDSGLRMVDLVNDLLDVSRIDQKRVMDNPTDVEVVNLILDIMKEMKQEAKQKKVTLTFNHSTNNSPTLFIDKKRLREVVQNLISNAIKYNTSPGKATITLASNANQITISVQDTGIGIPQEDQGEIFTKFYRASNARKSSTDGIGLGLYVVHSYVKGWGGTTKLESIRKKGTIVTITIPKKPKNHTMGINRKIEQNVKK